MARVVPSLVVEVIDNAFPWSGDLIQFKHADVYLSYNSAGVLAAVVQLVGEIPNELITLHGPEYARFVFGTAAITHAVQIWSSGSERWVFGTAPEFERVHPVALVRRALSECPDEAAAEGTHELQFISDYDLRTNLRLDISAVNQALAHGEWKAATVLAGSVIEALLLWALQERQRKDDGSSVADGEPVILAVESHGSATRKLLGMNLGQYITEAVNQKLIDNATSQALQLSKGFRNLIHPGRAQRIGEECNRATALLAVGAMERTIGAVSRSG